MISGQTKDDTRLFYNFLILTFLLYSTIPAIQAYFAILLQLKLDSIVLTGNMIGIQHVGGILGPFAIGHLLNKEISTRKLLLIKVILFIGILCFLFFKLPVFLLMLLSFCLGIILTSLPFTSDMSILRHLSSNPNHYSAIRGIGSVGFVVYSFVLYYILHVNSHSQKSILIGMLLPILLLLVAIIFLQPKNRQLSASEKLPHPSLRNFLKKTPKVYWLIIILASSNTLGTTAIGTFLPLRLNQMGVDNISTIAAIAVVAEIPILFFGAYIVRFLGLRLSLVFTLLATGIRLILLSHSNTILEMGSTQLLHAFSYGLMHSSIISYIRNHVQEEAKTNAMNCHLLLQGIARSLASIIGGYLIQRISYQAAFFYYGLIPLLFLFLLIHPSFKSLHKSEINKVKITRFINLGRFRQ